MIGRVSSPAFVGRREELRALADAVSAAAAGSESVVLISGEPGIGKSRLISEFALGSRDSAAMVLVGECPPLGHGELPYAPIVMLLRELGRTARRAGRVHTEADQLLSELTVQSEGVSLPAVADGSQARLFELLLAALLSASTTGPVVLVVDDLQWADRSTRDFLTFVVRAALDVAREVGARPLREQLEALARPARIDLDEATAGAEPIAAALMRLELTPREIDVLALIADGKTDRQIATELFISNKTANAHVAHILSKLSVHNRTAAAATARRLGLGHED